MHWNEATPFRLTPNMQHFLNPIGIEGLLTSGIIAIARSLTEPEVSSALNRLVNNRHLPLHLASLTWSNS